MILAFLETWLFPSRSVMHNRQAPMLTGLVAGNEQQHVLSMASHLVKTPTQSASHITVPV